jgi:hypothetical protein
MAKREKPRINIPVVAEVSRATNPPINDATPTVIRTATIDESGDID